MYFTIGSLRHLGGSAKEKSTWMRRDYNWSSTIMRSWYCRKFRHPIGPSQMALSHQLGSLLWSLQFLRKATQPILTITDQFHSFRRLERSARKLFTKSSTALQLLFSLIINPAFAKRWFYPSINSPRPRMVWSPWQLRICGSDIFWP